ncbi:hypothetical protein T01_4838 [Trichinella spiralis]|uniref:Uncharacterized protein n=1 Tax=Trichinella spiralis TaxID=6334 RepID=A0A0V1BB57_TRISP|nr:hypothetical protein T01_4838 [Trichinella spiralis]
MKRFCSTLASTIAFLWIVVDAAPLGLPYEEDGTFLTIEDFRNAMYLTTVIFLVTNDHQSMLVLILMLASWTAA